MTINKAMNIALSGLNAHQAALNVVSHNIANINTEGYRRQTVHFAEMRTPLYDNSVRGQIASLAGVKIDGITTASNDYLNNYYRTQNSIYEGLQAGADVAGQVANLLDELKDSALGDSLSAFYDAANSLNQNPTDYSLRVNFIEKAKAVANKFNSMDKTLSNYRESVVGTKDAPANSQLGTDISNLNDKLKNLADINRQIAMNKDDTSLQSQRDQILSEISGLADVTTTITAMGTADVKIGNEDLVKGVEVVGTLTYSVDTNGNPKISYKNKETGKFDPDFESKISKNGKIGGTLSICGEVLADAQNDLNKLAKAFIDEMNKIQTKVDANGKTPCYYDRINDKLVPSTNDYKLFEGTTAGDIKINDKVYKDPDKVAAARVDTTTANWEKAVGNGDNALFFYNAKSAKLTDLGGLSMQDFLISMGTKAALKADDLQKQADAQGAIVDNISNQILSEVGVNLDEELSNMIIYQQAYNASARVFSACVEIYDTLVNLGK